MLEAHRLHTEMVNPWRLLVGHALRSGDMSLPFPDHAMNGDLLLSALNGMERGKDTPAFTVKPDHSMSGTWIDATLDVGYWYFTARFTESYWHGPLAQGCIEEISAALTELLKLRGEAA